MQLNKSKQASMQEFLLLQETLETLTKPGDSFKGKQLRKEQLRNGAQLYQVGHASSVNHGENAYQLHCKAVSWKMRDWIHSWR